MVRALFGFFKQFSYKTPKFETLYFFVLVILGSCFLFAKSASATTYYVRADGTVTAANKASATSPNAVGTSLNMAQVKLATFLASDQILFSSQGGNYTEVLTIPSGGSGVNTEITYANVPTETPIIAITTGYLIDTNSKSNIIIDGLTANYTGSSASTNIGVTIKAGSNIQFKNFTSDMGGYGYNMWSNVVLSDIVFDHVTLTNCRAGSLLCLLLSGSSNSNVTMQNVIATNISISNAVTASITNSTFTGAITVTTGSNISITNIPSTAGMSLSNITTGTINNATSTGAITVTTGSNISITNIPSTPAITLSGVTTGTISNVIGSSGTGFDFTNSSNIVVNDSSMSNATDYGAFETKLASHDITYNRDTANNNLTHGFVAQDTSYNITYNNCTADNNRNIGFLARLSVNNIAYWYSEASYNGTVNDVSDGGGFLPHDSVTNVKCYYCIAHHNYNEGLGDVSDGTGNLYYNSINWDNGYAVGDTFKGSTVTTPSARSNIYYRKAGGNFVVNNGIFGGGKPREILNTGPSYTTLDYNLYKPLDDNKFYNTTNDANNISWITYHSTKETHSQNSDPLFVNATGNYTTSTDYQLSYLSPAIDTGTNVGLTTDYTGTNHIYGTPDIGVYEYQPPYTIGTSLVDPTGSIRLYSDGKYRYTTATSSTQSANFSVSPAGGWPSSDYSEYMNVTLDSWLTSGTKNKQWTATSSIATNTIYTIGNLAPNKYYQFKLDGAASTTAITGATCTNGLCLSDSSGNLTFTYTSGYSTHTFALEQNTGAPINVGISSISADSTIQLTITAQTATDADPGLHSAPYWFNETTGHSGGSSSSDWQTSTSFVDSGLSANTQYTYQVKARDNNLNESAYSDTLSKYTLADTPTNLSASSNSNSVSLTVDSLPNDTGGQSGYYFSRSGANSGWIQTNSWTDTGLSCGNSYTYLVKYRNGDGTETSEISTTKSTSGCGGGGGSPAMWTLPTMPSGGFKININNGALTTSNRNVLLGFNARTDIKKMSISMTGDFTDASQEDYVASKQWDLCSKLGGAVKNPTCPDGKYTIYARFYTVYGRTTGNAFASSTIILKSASISSENLQPNQTTSLNPFTKYLQYRQTNADIKRLQIFLNSDPDTKVADFGAGSPSKETNYFGLLTYKAVIKFQEKYAKDVLAPWGFVKGTGYVGKTTLAKINELIGNK